MRSRNAARGVACAALLLVSTPARAQVLLGYLFGDKLASPTFNMGFEVGVNFSNLDGLDGAERMNRTVFGLFGDWRLSENFHLTGAVLPFAGRGAEGLAPVPTGDPEIDSQTAAGTMKRSLNYVEIPLLLKWAPHREEGFRIGAGPSFGLVTGANDRYDATASSGTHYTIERDIGGQVPLRLRASSTSSGASAAFDRRAAYTHGLTDMRQDGSPQRDLFARAYGDGPDHLGKKPSP